MSKTTNQSKVDPQIVERLESAVNILGEVADAGICIATQKESVDGNLVVRASRNTPDNPFGVGDVIPTTEDLFCHRAANSKQFLHIDESEKDDKPSHYMGLPIFTPDEEVFGVICVKNAKLPTGFDEVKQTLQKFVSIIEDDLKSDK